MPGEVSVSRYVDLFQRYDHHYTALIVTSDEGRSMQSETRNAGEEYC
jgi:hypothetical protein